jgi:predicted Fe-Mo cluster-binding NifX family protein
MDLKNSVIAIVTDGATVSSHFGRALFYEVLNFADGKVVKRERRDKANHHSFGPEEAGHHEHGHHGESHEHRHDAMVSSILDCRAVVARGMGQGAVEHLHRSDLTPVLTSLHTIEEVIAAVNADALDHDPRRVHQHHGDS